MTVKHLIMTCNNVPNDFRKSLIELYKTKYQLTPNNIIIFGNKATFNNIALEPKDVLLFNNSYTDFGFDKICYLSACGYTIDTVPMVTKYIENKLLLYKMLYDMDVPIQKYCSEVIKGQRYNLTFHDDNLIVIDTTTDIVDGKVYLQWDKDVIEGYMIYFYLYKPIVITKIYYKSIHNIAHLSQLPENKFFTIGDNINIDKAKASLYAMPNIAEGYLEQLSKIMFRLQIASGEMIIGWSNQGIKVLNITSTHYPQLACFPEFGVYPAITNRFKEYMEI